VEILVVTKSISKFRDVLKLWAIDSCGEEVFAKIKRNILIIKIYGRSHVVFGLLDALVFAYPTERSRDNFIIYRFIEDNFYNYKTLLSLPFRIVMGFNLYAMINVGLHFVYFTQHLKFQLYLFNNSLMNITQDFDNDDEFLFYDDEYQKEIKNRLNFFIKRHIQFIK
jgi:hypothetical protein